MVKQPCCDTFACLSFLGRGGHAGVDYEAKTTSEAKVLQSAALPAKRWSSPPEEQSPLGKLLGGKKPQQFSL